MREGGREAWWSGKRGKSLSASVLALHCVWVFSLLVSVTRGMRNELSCPSTSTIRITSTSTLQTPLFPNLKVTCEPNTLEHGIPPPLIPPFPTALAPHPAKNIPRPLLTSATRPSYTQSPLQRASVALRVHTHLRYKAQRKSEQLRRRDVHLPPSLHPSIHSTVSTRVQTP